VVTFREYLMVNTQALIENTVLNTQLSTFSTAFSAHIVNIDFHLYDRRGKQVYVF
jgi:hypothetical protein